jgi:hypothetical protein
MVVYGGQPGDPPRTHARRRSGGRRTAFGVGVAAAIVVGAGTAGAATFLGSNGRPPSAAGAAGWASSAGDSTGPATDAGAADPDGSPPVPSGSITLAATGDIVMGVAPDGLPPDRGQGLFDQVKGALRADFAMGNLEQAITDGTGADKCSATSAGKTCFAFRTPAAFARNLKVAGFAVVNQANNHAYDFGPAGYRDTQRALDSVGVRYTGWPGMITVGEARGIKVAVIGFASYAWSNLCTDLDATTKIIKEAAGRADLVVVQVHQGAEGADKTHVKPGTEFFLGENRCDPIKFGHTAVDAGADLVVGHGPHVLRAMEFYRGRLIAYSLGNFAGYRALNYAGVVGVGGVLRVTLTASGAWTGGSLVPTYLAAPGVPRLDPSKQAISMVGGLSRTDFPTTGARLAADGTITAP